ncbi:MAG: GspH/FimT family pseudopilin [Methylococcales bacterium]|nr:GspH/FimT family pseudopilin [Methylococcales bacterium]
MMKHTFNDGFTALELMITVSIAAIVMVVAVPSYQGVLERNRLKQVLEGYKVDLQLTRTEALKRQTPVVISRKAGAAGAWCYGLTVKNDCDCAVSDSTAADFCELKRIDSANFGAIALAAQSANTNTFDPRRGTTGASGVTFTSEQYAGRVIVSNTGRVKSCAPTGGLLPSGKKGLPSLSDC